MSKAEFMPDLEMMEWLLTGRWEHSHPRDILDGITPQDACRKIDGVPYSIARIVAHMQWWQQERISVARGNELTDFEPRVDDWPAVAPDEWDGLVKDFLAGFDELLAIAADQSAMQRLIFDDFKVSQMLLSHPTHNSYHLGQIVLLRRLQGTWPMQVDS